MDYERLAKEYMETMFLMHKHKSHKQISDSMHGERVMLYFISRNEGKVIPSEISNEMGITSARVAAALNGLESKGLIIRRIDGEDRRRILIELTDAGRVQVQEETQQMIKRTADMLQSLGEEDAQHFIRIMKKLATRGPQDFD